MEYYTPIKKNETLSFSTIWMRLKGFVPCYMSQTEKDKYYIISLICGIYKTK